MGRLIDADKLLTDRMKSKYYRLPNGDLAIPLIDIEHAPTVDAEPIRQWIPVSERLPEIGDLVLICFREGRDCPYNRIAVGKLGSHEVVDKDFITIGAKTVWYTDRWYCDFDSVIAWIPLPKPYKGEQDE